MVSATIARRIRDCRYAKGWGPDELAERARISRTALYQIECGKTETPRAGTLSRIARALDLSVDALMSGGEAPLGRAASGLVAAGGRQVADDGGREGRESADGVGWAPAVAAHGSPGEARPTAGSRELEQKFRELLESPLSESIARLVEESHRLLPFRSARNAV